MITSEGRSFPVTTHFLDRAVPQNPTDWKARPPIWWRQPWPRPKVACWFSSPAKAKSAAPQPWLANRLPDDCQIRPLYGALPFAEQRKAIAPVKKGRKIVLSTSIAETSLTIEDIRVVVDAGRARRAHFDPASGMSRLVTEKVSKAEATQRAGRAGRVAPGDAYCLWTKGEHGALPAFAPAEIEAADLAGLALELAVWGSDDLAFLTLPPEGALAEARALLHGLGALDTAGRITAHGRALAAMPLHPRLAHMLQIAGKAAAPLAALLARARSATRRACRSGAAHDRPKNPLRRPRHGTPCGDRPNQIRNPTSGKGAA